MLRGCQERVRPPAPRCDRTINFFGCAEPSVTAPKPFLPATVPLPTARSIPEATPIVTMTFAGTSFAASQMSMSCPVFLLQSSQSGMTYHLLSVSLYFWTCPPTVGLFMQPSEKHMEAVWPLNFSQWARQLPLPHLLDVTPLRFLTFKCPSLSAVHSLVTFNTSIHSRCMCVAKIKAELPL